ncbi:SDR family oxidoreductase [Salinigranum salinum]|uniref:SDR family oxidoreductase n=1 Tax=Salinigranum salinum TaxID=1364937 RepID=UPI00126080A1|nr:SDR family oxidoreductase [Salinigranum salinum]
MPNTRVLVAGASGGTGRAVLRLLAPRPVTVRALTRSASKTDRLESLGADEVLVGDLFDPDDAKNAATDVDVVLSAVGSTLRDLHGGEFVDGVGAQNLVSAAAAADVRAFVMESALGVGDDPASLLATAFDAVIGPIQRAKADTEAALRAADLEHTILRPGVLTDGPRTDTVQVAEPGAKLWGTVSRADVARLMAAAPWTPTATDRTFEVVDNPLLRRREDLLTIDWVDGPDS